MKISSKIFVVAFKLPRLFKLDGEGKGVVGLRQNKGWIDSKVHFKLTLFHRESNKNLSYYHSNPIRPRDLAARMKKGSFGKWRYNTEHYVTRILLKVSPFKHKLNLIIFKI